MAVPASTPTCGPRGALWAQAGGALMRQAGLAGCHRRRRQPRTTIADPATPAPNLVQRVFNPLAPDQLWLADITSIPTGEGWLYLATVLDAFSRARRRLGHGRPPPTEPGARRAHHGPGHPPAGGRADPPPDRGRQYPSLAFGRRLQAAGLVPSMSRVANCWDNAVAERCFATLKGEPRRPPGVAHASGAAAPSSTISKASTTAGAATPPSAIAAPPPTKPPHQATPTMAVA